MWLRVLGLIIQPVVDGGVGGDVFDIGKCT